MRKLFVVLAVLVATGIAVWMWAPGLIGQSVTYSASEASGVPFSVGDVSLNPFAGTATVTDVTLESEEPFSSPCVANIPRITAKFDASTVLSSFIVVQEVSIEGVDLRVEQLGSRINVRELAARFEAYLATADTTEQPRVFVQELRIQGASGTLITDAGSRAFEMGDVVLRDLGSETAGTPVQVLAGNVLEPLLVQALSDAGLGGSLRGRLRGLFGRD